MRDVVISSGPHAVKVEGVKHYRQILHSFFSPFFDVIPVTASSKVPVICTISLNYDRDQYQQKMNQFQSGRSIILYKSKRQYHHVEGRLLSENNDQIIIALEQCIIAIQKNMERITLWTDNTADIAPPLRVIIRRIIRGAWERSGGILFHAAAASINNKAVLFMGPKGSGKTHLLLEFVERGFSILSFDRVMLTQEANHIACYAWPTYFNISQKSVSCFNNSIFKNSQLKENDFGQDGKISWEAKQVHHLHLSKKAIWKKTIFPRLEPNRSKKLVKHPDQAFILRQLLDECLTINLTHSQWWESPLSTQRLYENALNISRLMTEKSTSFQLVRYSAKHSILNDLKGWIEVED